MQEAHGMGDTGEPDEPETIPVGHALCHHCGETFEQPEGKAEPHGETLYWCPHCGHGDWVWWND